MAKDPKAKVITANDLVFGDVIYIGPNGDWVNALNEARVFPDETSAETELSHAIRNQNKAVGVYLADVLIQDGEIIPAHFRETFRATGPSNYHHGKQEQV